MRTIPAELRRRYESEGWWTQDTIGDMVAGGLAASPDTGFRVYSEVRPFTGTFADVELLALQVVPHLAGHAAVQFTDAVRPPARSNRQGRHVERLVLGVRVRATQLE